MSNFRIEIEGLEELEKLGSIFATAMKKNLLTAMKKAVAKVEANVVPLVPIGVSGNLRRSIHGKTNTVGSTIIGRVGSTMTREIYPEIMEFGRRPGRMPPPSALERWVQIVLKVPAEEVKGVAFVVARSIGKKGIKGRAFMRKGWTKSKNSILGYFRKAVDDTVRELDGD
jgi:hypothetical protein